MTVIVNIKNDLKKSMKEKLVDKKNNIRIILGEIQRDKHKKTDDESIFKVLKQLKKLELEKIKLFQKDKNPSMSFLKQIEEYLPAEISEKDIIDYIDNNIDFSKLKNRMMAINIIKKHFSNKSIDGKLVKKIIEER